ncbi:UNVERIFIED_CONTAM: hypothetical protein FKN15_059280 [Acipenser sinensis]
MGKAVYRRMIMKNENIPGTVVRTSTIPEELGRLVYLSTDKTGAGSLVQRYRRYALVREVPGSSPPSACVWIASPCVMRLPAGTKIATLVSKVDAGAGSLVQRYRRYALVREVPGSSPPSACVWIASPCVMRLPAGTKIATLVSKVDAGAGSLVQRYRRYALVREVPGSSPPSACVWIASPCVMRLPAGTKIATLVSKVDAGAGSLVQRYRRYALVREVPGSSPPSACVWIASPCVMRLPAGTKIATLVSKVDAGAGSLVQRYRRYALVREVPGSSPPSACVWIASPCVMRLPAGTKIATLVSKVDAGAGSLVQRYRRYALVREVPGSSPPSACVWIASPCVMRLPAGTKIATLVSKVDAGAGSLVQRYRRYALVREVPGSSPPSACVWIASPCVMRLPAGTKIATLVSKVDAGAGSLVQRYRRYALVREVPGSSPPSACVWIASPCVMRLPAGTKIATLVSKVDAGAGSLVQRYRRYALVREVPGSSPPSACVWIASPCVMRLPAGTKIATLVSKVDAGAGSLVQRYRRYALVREVPGSSPPSACVWIASPCVMRLPAGTKIATLVSKVDAGAGSLVQRYRRYALVREVPGSSPPSACVWIASPCVMRLPAGTKIATLVSKVDAGAGSLVQRYRRYALVREVPGSSPPSACVWIASPCVMRLPAGTKIATLVSKVDAGAGSLVQRYRRYALVREVPGSSPPSACVWIASPCVMRLPAGTKIATLVSKVDAGAGSLVQRYRRYALVREVPGSSPPSACVWIASPCVMRLPAGTKIATLVSKVDAGAGSLVQRYRRYALVREVPGSSPPSACVWIASPCVMRLPAGTKIATLVSKVDAGAGSLVQRYRRYALVREVPGSSPPSACVWIASPCVMRLPAGTKIATLVSKVDAGAGSLVQRYRRYALVREVPGSSPPSACVWIASPCVMRLPAGTKIATLVSKVDAGAGSLVQRYRRYALVREVPGSSPPSACVWIASPCVMRLPAGTKIATLVSKVDAGAGSLVQRYRRYALVREVPGSSPPSACVWIASPCVMRLPAGTKIATLVSKVDAGAGSLVQRYRRYALVREVPGSSPPSACVWIASPCVMRLPAGTKIATLVSKVDAGAGSLVQRYRRYALVREVPGSSPPSACVWIASPCVMRLPAGTKIATLVSKVDAGAGSLVQRYRRYALVREVPGSSPPSACVWIASPCVMRLPAGTKIATLVSKVDAGAGSLVQRYRRYALVREVPGSSPPSACVWIASPCVMRLPAGTKIATLVSKVDAGAGSLVQRYRRYALVREVPGSSPPSACVWIASPCVMRLPAGTKIATLVSKVDAGAGSLVQRYRRYALVREVPGSSPPSACVWIASPCVMRLPAGTKIATLVSKVDAGAGSLVQRYRRYALVREVPGSSPPSACVWIASPCVMRLPAGTKIATLVSKVDAGAGSLVQRYRRYALVREVPGSSPPSACVWIASPCVMRLPAGTKIATLVSKVDAGAGSLVQRYRRYALVREVPGSSPPSACVWIASPCVMRLPAGTKIATLVSKVDAGAGSLVQRYRRYALVREVPGSSPPSACVWIASPCVMRLPAGTKIATLVSKVDAGAGSLVQRYRRYALVREVPGSSPPSACVWIASPCVMRLPAGTKIATLVSKVDAGTPVRTRRTVAWLASPERMRLAGESVACTGEGSSRAGGSGAVDRECQLDAG